jgi:hypothetical protein
MVQTKRVHLVIASEAKQSMREKVDCFVALLLAMTTP